MSQGPMSPGPSLSLPCGLGQLTGSQTPFPLEKRELLVAAASQRYCEIEELTCKSM